MAALIWLSDFVIELTELMLFLESKSPGASARASMAINESIQSLEKFPSLGRMSYEDSRARVLTVRFGGAAYIIIYEYANDEVVLTSLRHSKEDWL
jgi:plasmid stabilization system protein ParE